MRLSAALTPSPAAGTRPPATRAAFTLVEVMVALAVGGVVFGAFALVVARQERAHADLARRIRARAQMQEGAAALAADLRGVSPPAGDIPPGGARDSAIEFRATVGTAIVCGVPGRALATGLASFVAPPEAGDTAWTYTNDTAPGTWIPLVVTGVTVPAPGTAACAALADAGVRSTRRRPGIRYTLELSEAPDTPSSFSSALTAIRVTRPVRYSLYRAPDAAWYLGRREWSTALGRFASIQPVSGPYRAYSPPGSDASGLELRYFAADGAPIASGATESDRIARVVITLRALPPPNRPPRPRRDVSTLSVAFRNRQ